MRQRKIALLACTLTGFSLFAATSVARGQEVTGQETATTGSE